MIDVFLMLGTIAGPTLFVLTLVLFFCGRGGGFGRLKSVFELHTEDGLIRQGLLWLVIGVPMSVGMAFGAWVWKGYEISMTPSGYKFFLEISILPLAIMSISLPLAGLVARLHSTQQTARQILISTSKNNPDAYYAHRKGMIEYFKDIGEIKYFGEYEFSYKAHPVLQKRFFVGSPEDGWPKMRDSVYERIESKISFAALCLRRVLDGSSKRALSDYLQASIDIYLAAEALHIKEITRDMARRGVFVRYEGSEGGAATLGVTTLESLAALRFVREFYNNFCDFSGRARMEIPREIEDVFLKTEYWLSKGLFIEALHAAEIAELVNSGVASFSEGHSRYQEDV